MSDTSERRAIYLLGDSQLLFRRERGRPLLALLDELSADARRRGARAVLLSASTGDDPDQRELFVAAMEVHGIVEVGSVPAIPSARDLERLEDADVIALSGGDVRRGWDAFVAAGLDALVARRHAHGALLVGISAGAMQLGRLAWDERGSFDTLGLVPFVVGAHEEPRWPGLRAVLERMPSGARGLGVPLGGGAIFRADGSLTPVGKGCLEL